jgi:hypothetical protein
VQKRRKQGGRDRGREGEETGRKVGRHDTLHMEDMADS